MTHDSRSGSAEMARRQIRAIGSNSQECGGVLPRLLLMLARPGLPSLTRVAVPAFSCASRVCRVAAVLIPACPAITATAAPPGSADNAARTAAAELSPAAGERRGARVCRGVGGAVGRAGAEVLGACRSRDFVSYSPERSRISPGISGCATKLSPLSRSSQRLSVPD